MNDIERHEALLKAVDNRSIKDIEKALGKPETQDFQANLVKGLKSAYTNVNSIFHREDENKNHNEEEVRKNRLLFKNLLKVAENHKLDLSNDTNDLIDRLERDINAFRKSGKTVESKEHPLYQMGEYFIKYDIKKEAAKAMKPVADIMQKVDINTKPSLPKQKSITGRSR